MIRVDTSSGRLFFRGEWHRAVIGRGGAVAAETKREGDGATPLGRYRILGALLRPGRVAAPETALPWRWLRPWDGWSDDPADPAYNRPVAHPHGYRAERLWRDKHVYDVILVTDHNGGPPIPGLGSAIFLHLARPDWRPTEGCVAMARQTMLDILPRLAAGAPLEII
ncbi:MAG: L,D-transpeptidase family protein [Pigmentiphaga sp.]|nr:L,D-transpeptidase family protein [Pigmentiphaga sp.]